MFCSTAYVFLKQKLTGTRLTLVTGTRKKTKKNLTLKARFKFFVFVFLIAGSYENNISMFKTYLCVYIFIKFYYALISFQLVKSHSEYSKNEKFVARAQMFYYRGT